ncbi:MAG: ChbG/HpnK family deacetylase, partial [Bacteroidota bacterium]
RGIRLPRDDHRLAACHDPRHALRKTSRAFVHALLCRWGSRRIPAGLSTVDRVYGLCQSGEMSADYVRLVLQHLEVPTAELYFHPATIDMEPLGPNRRDLAALLSPSVREALEKRGLRPATYYTLREE